MLFQWSVCDLANEDEKVLLIFLFFCVCVLTYQGFKLHFQLDKNAKDCGLHIDTEMQITSEDDCLLKVSG